MATNHQLVGTAAGASATLGTPFSGRRRMRADGGSVCVGTLTGTIRLRGSAAGSSRTTMAYQAVRLAGSAAGSSSTALAADTFALGCGQSNGSSTTTGTLSLDYPFWKGQRIQAIGFEPNWDTEFRLRCRYQTQVREALDASEWRRQLLPRCLYGGDYLITTTDAKQSAYLRKTFELSDDMPMAVPLWPEATELTTGATAGDTTLTVDDTAGLLSQLQYALVWQDEYTSEIVRISETTVGTLTLDSPVQGTWAAGCKVIPLVIAFVDKPDFDSLTDEHADVAIKFEELLGYGDQSKGELPELPEQSDRATTTSCHQTVKFDIQDVWIMGADRFELIVEYGPTASGPWTTYLTVLDANLDQELDKFLELENYWDGNTYLRLSAGYLFNENGCGGCGCCKKCPDNVEAETSTLLVTPLCIFKPQASVVACPEIANISNLYDCPRPLSTVTGTPRGNVMVTSCRETPLITPTRTYIEVTRKYEFEYASDHDVTPTPNNLDATCDTPGAEIRWTRLCTDPQTSSYATGNGDIVPGGEAFACTVIARAYKDGCWSPAACVLVDKKLQTDGLSQVYIQMDTWGQVYWDGGYYPSWESEGGFVNVLNAANAGVGALYWAGTGENIISSAGFSVVHQNMAYICSAYVYKFATGNLNGTITKKGKFIQHCYNLADYPLLNGILRFTVKALRTVEHETDPVSGWVLPRVKIMQDIGMWEVNCLVHGPGRTTTIINPFGVPYVGSTELNAAVENILCAIQPIPDTPFGGMNNYSTYFFGRSWIIGSADATETVLES